MRLLIDRHWLDLQYGFRKLARSPRFTAVVVLTLALGVGANTAIFSAIDAALFRPFPLHEPDQLTAVYSYNSSEARYISSSFPDYDDFRRRSTSFQQLSAYVRFPLNLTIADRTDPLPVECVTGDYFAMLRLVPLAGRLLDTRDDGQPVAVISERLWRQRFSSRPDLIGDYITVEDRAFTVVGIVPARYRGLNLNWFEPPEIWLPLGASYLVVPRLQELDILNQRGMPWLVLVGRRQPGVSIDRAQAELQSIAAGVAEAEPGTNRHVTVAAFPLNRSKFWPSYRDLVSRSLAVFAIAGVLVLLLACANVSNMLLERGLARRGEIALRLSLGATRTSLLRQLLVENLLLLAPGITGALVVAYALQRVLPNFPTALGLPLALDLTLDYRVLAFCAVASLIAVALFSLAPLFHTGRVALSEALKDTGNAGEGSDRGRLRQSLVVAQVAFSMILLIGGGVLSRSLASAYTTDLGFRTDHLLIVGASLRADRAGGTGVERLNREMMARLTARPGVESASFASYGLLNAAYPKVPVTAGGGATNVASTWIGPAFFRTTGIDLIAGREFTASDESAVIVNRTLAEQLWGDQNAVGRTVLVREEQAQAEVVGVVSDAKHGSVWEPPTPYLYFPAPQHQITFVVRTLVEPASLIPSIRGEWEALAPREPLSFRTGDDLVRSAITPQRLTAALLGSFAALAVVLAAIGIYSIVSYSVERRAREIGIRLAIGAAPGDVLREMLSRSLLMAATGIIFGGAIAFALVPMIEFLARGVSARDGVTFAGVTLLVALVSLCAALRPSWRAARVNPSVALRSE